MMAFYNEKAQLYLETEVSAISLEAGLLLVRNGMWLPRNKMPHNTALQPVVLISKSLMSTRPPTET